MTAVAGVIKEIDVVSEEQMAIMKIRANIETTAKAMINHTRVKMFQRNPFWSSILIRIPMYAVPMESPIRTAATDGRSIYWNPLFMYEIGEEGRQFVLAHEILHLLNLTFKRKGSRDHKLWNAATDYANNQILVDGGFVMPTTDQIRKVIREMDLKVPVDPELLAKVREKWSDSFKEGDLPVGLLEPKFKSMTAEEIYEELLKDQSKEPGERQYDIGSGGIDEHIVVRDEDLSASDRQHIHDALAGAKLQCKDPGKLPAGLRRYFSDMNEPKISWRDELASIAKSFEMSDYKWTPPDPSLFAQGITVPYVEYEARLRVKIGIDTSGSISQDDLNKVISEIMSISRNFPHFALSIFCCDTQVYGEDFFDKSNISDLEHWEAKGGGGTMFRPVFEKFAEDSDDWDWFIFFTDGYGEGWCEDFEPILKNVVWLINQPGGGHHPTWGKVIDYNKYD